LTEPVHKQALATLKNEDSSKGSSWQGKLAGCQARLCTHQGNCCTRLSS